LIVFTPARYKPIEGKLEFKSNEHTKKIYVPCVSQQDIEKTSRGEC